MILGVFWRAGAILVCLGSLIAVLDWHFLLKNFRYTPDPTFASHRKELSEAIALKGSVPVHELSANWDLVCLATPYCEGHWLRVDNAKKDKACYDLRDDGAYGLAFFQGDPLMSTETYVVTFSRGEKLTATKECFGRDEDPILVQDGEGLLMRPRVAQ